MKFWVECDQQTKISYLGLTIIIVKKQSCMEPVVWTPSLPKKNSAIIINLWNFNKVIEARNCSPFKNYVLIFLSLFFFKSLSLFLQIPLSFSSYLSLFFYQFNIISWFSKWRSCVFVLLDIFLHYKQSLLLLARMRSELCPWKSDLGFFFLWEKFSRYTIESANTIQHHKIYIIILYNPSSGTLIT